MLVVKVQVEGLCGPTCYDYNKDRDSILEELRELLDPANEEDDLDIHIWVSEMDEQEFESLPEFAGY